MAHLARLVQASWWLEGSRDDDAPSSVPHFSGRHSGLRRVGDRLVHGSASPGGMPEFGRGLVIALGRAPWVHCVPAMFYVSEGKMV